MAIVATGQITLVDVSATNSIQAVLESSAPVVQVYNMETGAFSPNWEANDVTITPVIYMSNGTLVPLDSSNLTIRWFANKKEILLDDERFSISGNKLQIRKNVMDSGTPSLHITAEVTYVETSGYVMRDMESVSYTLLERSSSDSTIFSVFATPQGGAVMEKGVNKVIDGELYLNGDKVEITEYTSKIKWFKGDTTSSGWRELVDQEGKKQLVVTDGMVEGTETFLLQVTTRDGKVLSSQVTLIDIGDPYQAIIEGALTFKEHDVDKEIYIKVFESGEPINTHGFTFSWYLYSGDHQLVSALSQEEAKILLSYEDVPDNGYLRVEVLNEDKKRVATAVQGLYKAEKGEDGKTLFTWVKYADSPTSGMSDSPIGKEYIGLAYNQESPVPSDNYEDYDWVVFKGDQGIPGPQGYTWIKYADDKYGTGMSNEPDDKKYIGMAFNKLDPEKSEDPADYTWSLMPQFIEIGGVNLIPGASRGTFVVQGLVPMESGVIMDLYEVMFPKDKLETYSGKGLYFKGYPIEIEEDDSGKFTFTAKWKNRHSVSLGFVIYDKEGKEIRTGTPLVANGQEIEYDEEYKSFLVKEPNTSTYDTLAFDTDLVGSFEVWFGTQSVEKVKEDLYVSKWSLERGDVPTNWRPSLAEEEARIIRLESDIKRTEEELGTMVRRGEYDSDRELLKEQVSLLNQNAERILARVELNEKDISSAISELIIQNGKISSFVSREEYDRTKVGGRNLLLDQETMRLESNDNPDWVKVEYLDDEDGTIIVTVLKDHKHQVNAYTKYFHDFFTEPNSMFKEMGHGYPYTISADVRFTGSGVGQIGFDTRNPDDALSARSERIAHTGGSWERVHATKEESNRSINTESFFSVWMSYPKAGDTLELRRVKLERGRIPTDYSPSPEEVKQKYTSLIEQTEKMITIQMEKEIREVENEISKANSKIEIEADRISSEIHETNTKLNESEERLSSKIEQTSQSLKLDFSKELESFEIGGENLLKDSGFTHLWSKPSDPLWHFSGSPSSVHKVGTNPDIYSTTIKGSGTERLLYGESIPIETKGPYTFSLLVEGPAPSLILSPSGRASFESELKLLREGTGNWSLYGVTVELDRASTGLSLINRNSQSTKIKMPKLERGSKATGWGPSPSDIDERVTHATAQYEIGINGVKGDLSKTTQSLVETKQEFANFKLDTDGALIRLRGDIKDAEGRITEEYQSHFNFEKTKLEVAFNRKIGSLSLGGGNLLKSTDWKDVRHGTQIDELEHWYKMGSNAKIYNSSDGYKFLKLEGGVGQYVDLETGTYVFSALRTTLHPLTITAVHSDGTTAVFKDVGSGTDAMMSNLYRPIVQLVEIPKAGRYDIRFSPEGNVIDLRNMQLEAGEVPTGWAPNKEELEGKVEEYHAIHTASEKELSSRLTKLTQTADTLEERQADFKVSVDGLQLSLNGLKSDVTGMKREYDSKFEVTEKGIDSRFSSLAMSGYNLLRSTNFNDKEYNNSDWYSAYSKEDVVYSDADPGITYVSFRGTLKQDVRLGKGRYVLSFWSSEAISSGVSNASIIKKDIKVLENGMRLHSTVFDVAYDSQVTIEIGYGSGEEHVGRVKLEAGEVPTGWSVSPIEQSAKFRLDLDGLEMSFEKKFNDGGKRNLLRDTDFARIGPGTNDSLWIYPNQSTYAYDFDPGTRYAQIDSFAALYQRIPDKLTPGEYTLTFWSGNATIDASSIRLTNGEVKKIGSQRNTAGAYIHEFRITTTIASNQTLYFDGSSSNRYWISKIFLERGEFATGWRPDVYDLRTDIQAEAGKIMSRIYDNEDNMSEIEQDIHSITSRVSNVEGNYSQLRQDVRSISSTVEEAKGNASTALQTARNITLKVRDADGNVSSIKLNSGELSLSASQIRFNGEVFGNSNAYFKGHLSASRLDVGDGYDGHIRLVGSKDSAYITYDAATIEGGRKQRLGLESPAIRLWSREAGIEMYTKNGKFIFINEQTSKGVAFEIFGADMVGTQMIFDSEGIHFRSGNYAYRDVYARNFYTKSDRRAKENIIPYERGRALKEIMETPIYRYNYIGNKEKESVGLIYDEAPELVRNTERDDGQPNTIDLYSMSSIMWQGVRELNERLSEEIENIKEKMEELERQIKNS